MDEGTIRFRVTSVATSGAVTVSITGVLDGSGRRAAGAELDEVGAALSLPGLVVIDVTAVEFLAAAGVHVIAGFALECRRRGFVVRLAAAPDTIVRWVIRISDLDRHVPVADALDGG